MSPTLLIALYWVTTVLFCVAMLGSAYQYLFGGKMRDCVVRELGFPPFFPMELGIAKVLGVAALLIPGVIVLKEWAYAGFTITLISAFVAHVAHGDGPKKFMAPVLFGVLLAVSYFTSHPVL